MVTGVDLRSTVLGTTQFALVGLAHEEEAQEAVAQLDGARELGISGGRALKVALEKPERLAGSAQGGGRAAGSTGGSTAQGEGEARSGAAVCTPLLRCMPAGRGGQPAG